MLNDLKLWPQKLSKGLELAEEFYLENVDNLPKNIKKIAFFGMGGSGIAGRIIKTFIDFEGGPVTFVVETPSIPTFVDENTLAIVTTYSGNTWESVVALCELIKKKIPTIVVTNGGKAKKLGKKHKLPLMVVPEVIAPRAALGYFLGFFLGLLDELSILDGKSKIQNFKTHATAYIPQFSEQSFFDDFINNVSDKDCFYIWGISGESEAFSYRAQTQFNENSKVQAVSLAFPELCHNFVAGFTKRKSSPFVIFFHTNFVSDYLKKAVLATEKFLCENGVRLYKSPILGDTFTVQLFNIILWSDFASCYLGIARGVEVNSVKLIDHLKEKHKEEGIFI
jgi:glucose/mannose-6-phosphate isomerase